MIRLDKITITNYKNIVVNEVELSNFNILVGPNNSGKSNFISSLSFLNHVISGSNDMVNSEFSSGFFENYGLIVPYSDGSKDGKATFGLTIADTEMDIQYFYQILIYWKLTDARNQDYEHRIGKESFSYKYINKPGPSTKIFERKGKDIEYGPTASKLPKIKIPDHYSTINLFKVLISNSNVNDEINEAFRALDIVLKTDPIYLSNIELNRTEKTMKKFGGRLVSFDFLKEIYLMYRSNETKYNFLKETLKNILRIDDIHVILFNFEDDEDIGEDVEFMVFLKHMGTLKQIDELSDGSIMLIALVVRLIASDQEIFLIEEPENSLHPKALVDFIRFIQSYKGDRQFIIATHSIPIINTVEPEDVLIAICDGSGVSEIQKVPNQRELKKRLSQGYLVFSDAVFFQDDDIEEDEF